MISLLMASDDNSENQLMVLQRQLATARDEINNLRKEIKNMKYSQCKEISSIRATVSSWKCSSCQRSNETSNNSDPSMTEDGSLSNPREQCIEFKPIGFINTGFVKKRAVPRQPNVNLNSHGRISLCNFVFTNPEHSLEGLDGFSHLWIIFYFHQNQSNHIRAKVAPPRLNGARVGVFGTRSPHRPCPIGLSLVQIDKIEGSCIYFSGVDMIDGTPVLDLKPYIPHYDNPADLSTDYPDGTSLEMERLELDGQESDSETAAPVTVVQPRRPDEVMVVESGPSQREAPDGEECHLEGASPPVSYLLRSISPLPTHVRVPEWISQSATARLQVLFSPHAEHQLSTLLEEEHMRLVITDILREDPRSVYLRDRYANQFYTFLIDNFHVSCKFDDNNLSVRVFKVTHAGLVCECGLPEWQCLIHGASEDT